MFWCFTGVLTSLIAVQIEKPPLKALSDLHFMKNFKLKVIDGGSTKSNLFVWSKNNSDNLKAYKDFIEPYFIKGFTEAEFKELRNPQVAMVLEDFTVDFYFKKCKKKTLFIF